VSLYLDTSALLKRYVDEPGSAECERLLLSDASWVTGRHTAVELRRNLARLLEGAALHGARAQFAEDWRRMHVVEVDELTCEIAADIAEATGARSLDALHLAALSRAGKGALSLVSFDLREARAARALGIAVLGC
jgi:predicted nucleic acid-binding protein